MPSTPRPPFEHDDDDEKVRHKMLKMVWHNYTYCLKSETVFEKLC
jgi:hypothetical protein